MGKLYHKWFEKLKLMEAFRVHGEQGELQFEVWKTQHLDGPYVQYGLRETFQVDSLMEHKWLAPQQRSCLWRRFLTDAFPPLTNLRQQRLRDTWKT